LAHILVKHKTDYSNIAAVLRLPQITEVGKENDEDKVPSRNHRTPLEGKAKGIENG